MACSDNIYKFQDNDVLGYDKVIVFGVNGRGDYIEDENGDSKMRVIKVAHTFDEFLNLLHD